MKPMYATSKADRSLNVDSDDHKYNTNYDGDTFEDNTDQEELDDAGDFDLPENHPQNIDTTEPNIK